MKKIPEEVWAFDAEWIPDPLAGRLLYGLPDTMTDAEVMQHMWRQAAKSRSLIPTEADLAMDTHDFLQEGVNRPYLKTNLCRLVSVSAVVRRQKAGQSPKLVLFSLPASWDEPVKNHEPEIIHRFLGKLDQRISGPLTDFKGNPKSGYGKGIQIVGYNSSGADFHIFVQRAIINGMQFEKLNDRPTWPKDGVDYYSDQSPFHVDLQRLVGGFNRSNPSLNEMATLSGIPGKMDTNGNEVSLLWLAGQLDEIIRYNEFDALTTYLLWLRVMHFLGNFSATEYATEQQLVENLIAELSPQPRYAHLQQFQEEWNRLRRLTGQL